MPRSIQFGGWEHQYREIHARHFHAGEGNWRVWGDGKTVLKVHSQRGKRPICDVIGEDGFNELGEEFRYSDYFLPEELTDPRG